MTNSNRKRCAFITILLIWISIFVLPIFFASSIQAGGIYTNALPGENPPSGTVRINAYGGAQHGTKLRAVANCPDKNTDCNWSLHPNGMIVSDTNPKLAWNAYGGAKHGADIVLVDNCRPDIPDCTWTSTQSRMIVSKANPNLAVNAYGGFRDGAPIKLVNNCTPQSDGCRWWYMKMTPGWFPAQLPVFLYLDIGNSLFRINAYGGAKHRTELKLVNDCPINNSDCTWTHSADGTIRSATNGQLLWNAYGGALAGNKVTLVNNCPTNNTDCIWDFRIDGLLVSRTNPNLAVKALGGPVHSAPLVLVDDCKPEIPGCKWDYNTVIY